MNCREWEEKIALYAGGELAGSAAADVERHIGHCPGCQVLASGMRESLGWIKSAHEDIPDEAHFAAVRARVLAELARGTRRRIWWPVAVGAVAIAAIVLVLLVARPRPAPPAPVVAEAPAAPYEPPTPVQPGEPASVKPAGMAKRRRALGRSPYAEGAQGQKLWPHKDPEREPSKPLLVKLVTEDPNIVIYWIADTRGGE